MNRLDIREVAFRYRNGKTAVDGVSLSLEPGIFGLLGRNGAGKSTLLRIVATVSRATSGSVAWNGVDIRDDLRSFRRLLGFVAQDTGVYPNLTAEEFLMYVAALKGLPARVARPQIAELIELVNLTGERRVALSGYSGGMRQRVAIAQALLGDPQLLVMDEPTVGLDPVERNAIMTKIAELAKNAVVILSTHIVSDVESFARTIGVMEQGKLVACRPRESFATPEGRASGSLEEVYLSMVAGSRRTCSA